MHRTKAPSDEGAVSEADWGREKTRICNAFLSLRPFGPPPSSEGGRALPRQCDKLKFDEQYLYTAFCHAVKTAIKAKPQKCSLAFIILRTPP